MFKLGHKVKSFVNLPSEMKWMGVETLLVNAAVSLMVKVVSIKRLKRYIEKPIKGQEQKYTTENYKKAYEVGWMVDRVNTYIPWKSECLEKAITACYLLRRRKLASTLYLGVSKQEDRVIAHACLEHGHMTITGKKFKDKYHNIIKISNEKCV